MKAIGFLLLSLPMLASCAGPEVMHAGETRCVEGDCSGLGSIQRDLHDPAFQAAVEAAKQGEPR